MPARLFLCYAREDHKWAELLRSHLVPLEAANRLSAFMDRQIDPGALWSDEIQQELHSADLVLAVVSVNLLNSKYAIDVELRTAFQRHRAGEVTLVPVIADYCYWEGTPLRDFQALPSDDSGRIKPLVDWMNPNIPLTAVVRALEQIAAGRKARPAPLPPDRGGDGLMAGGDAPPGRPTDDMRVVTARSVEMLDLAFASASALLERATHPSMWVERLEQRIRMTVRVDSDWSVRYEKEMAMTAQGAGAIVAAPFKIIAQPDVMSRLTLFDVDARYEELNAEMQPLMFPAYIRGQERGFAVVFSPPITSAAPRTFRAWFAVQREFAGSLAQGKDDVLACATLQLAHEHRAELEEFSVLLSAELPRLEVVPEFQCERVAEGERAAGLGAPYRRYSYRAPAQQVSGRLRQLIRLRRVKS